MKRITPGDVKRAIRQYDNGARPYRDVPARAWYLVTRTGIAYPLKYVYALAIGREPSSFHTAEAEREMRRLRLDVRREPRDPQAEFERRVRQALKDPEGRAARLARARRVPRKLVREVIYYERNPDVVAEVSCVPPVVASSAATVLRSSGGRMELRTWKCITAVA
jgi:5-methylcytosine-specific restriction protein A